MDFNFEDDVEFNAKIQFMQQIVANEKRKLESTNEAIKQMEERNKELNLTRDNLLSKLCNYHTRGLEDNLNLSKLVEKPLFEIIERQLENIEKDKADNNATKLVVENKISTWKDNFENTDLLDYVELSSRIDYLKNHLVECSSKLKNCQKNVDIQKKKFKENIDNLQSSVQLLQNIEKEQTKCLTKLNEILECKTNEAETTNKYKDNEIELKKKKIIELENKIKNDSSNKDKQIKN